MTMKNRRFITLLCTLGVTALCPVVLGQSATDGQGHYAIYVRGYWSGLGDATVTANTVTITAKVQLSTGQTGSLVISSLPLSASNHFSGTGTVMGVTVNVDGRVQPPDPTAGPAGPNNQSVTTNAVLGATLLGGGHAGRVAGGRDPLPPGP
jgi:hypothetical protein